MRDEGKCRRAVIITSVVLYLLAAASNAISFWPNRCGREAEYKLTEIPVSILGGIIWPAQLAIRIGIAGHNPMMAIAAWGCPPAAITKALTPSPSATQDVHTTRS